MIQQEAFPNRQTVFRIPRPGTAPIPFRPAKAVHEASGNGENPSPGVPGTNNRPTAPLCCEQSRGASDHSTDLFRRWETVIWHSRNDGSGASLPRTNPSRTFPAFKALRMITTIREAVRVFGDRRRAERCRNAPSDTNIHIERRSGCPGIATKMWSRIPGAYSDNSDPSPRAPSPCGCGTSNWVGSSG